MSTACSKFREGDVGEGDTHHDLSGSAANVVQARDISGGVHFQLGVMTLPVPRQLPPDVVPFTNRETNMARLHAWLDTPDEQAATAEVIAGIGGVGKTSLAAHWAHQVRDRFPDGDLYLDLRGYDVQRPVSAAEALDQLLRAFDVPWGRIPAGLDTKAALYRSLLHRRRMLVILDNVATVEQIRPLLPGSPTCRVLVTSRNQLTGLATREGAHRMPLDVLPPERAVELLEQICGTDRMRDDSAGTATLARYCDYLPLALRIVAERLVARPSLPVADVVEELAEARERLDVLTTEGDVYTTVRAVFSWSYQALSPDAGRMFRLLALPTGPDISATAAAVLAEVPRGKARRQLQSLVDAHLLQEKSAQRYRFHDLLRIYAAECAEADEPAEERRAACRRLLLWYAHSADAAARAIAPHFSRIAVRLPEPPHEPHAFANHPAALHWCDSEHANLVAAVDQAADLDEHAIAWQLPVVVFAFYLVRRPFTEWIKTHRIGLASARQLGKRPAEVWLETSLAIAYRELGQYDSALDCLQRALPGWREIGQRWGEAWTLRDIGDIHHLQGRPQEAIAKLEQAHALHVEEGDSWGEAVALSRLAMARNSLGRFDEAVSDLNRAVDIYRGHGDQRNVASALSSLGLVHTGLGQLPKAIEYLTQAVAIHQTVDDWHGEALAHERLATIFNDAGQTDKAGEHWHAAATLYDALGDPRASEIKTRLASTNPGRND